MKLSYQEIENYNEEELLFKASKEGVQDAATKIFLFYRDLIYGVSLKYLKDKNQAEDAMMEIYLEFINKIKKYEVKNVKSWLHVLTKNYCLMQIRKEKWTEEKMKYLNVVYSEDYFHPIEKMDIEVKENKLNACIDRLKEDQKNCIRSFYFEKKSYQEIADLYSLEWGKIRSFIQNGRRNLKHCMESK